MSLSEDSSYNLQLNQEQQSPVVDAWEEAYLRFETPEEEIEKFTKRLLRLGASSWPTQSRVVELFCGRGNGLHALEKLGFHDIEGVDFSARLVEQYRGRARCHVADCRNLPFADSSKDAAIVQGGLHHLLQLPEDLDGVFGEIRRVLTSDGYVIFVEPWLTPFLRFVHILTENQVLRRLSQRLDALSTMIEYERTSYVQWLDCPDQIVAVARRHFVPLCESFAWGKWNFVGKPRS